jgi:hypothetical protein
VSRSEVKPGDVVQIDPNHDITFGGCFLQVTEVRAWGVIGFVAIPKEKGQPPARAYYRCPWDGLHPVGRAEWLPSDEPPVSGTPE